MRNFHYPKPVRCFRIGNPAMKTGYSIVTLKGKQAIAPMERLIALFHQFSYGFCPILAYACRLRSGHA